MSKKSIYVTQPFMLPIGEIIPHLDKIRLSKKLTNNGPFHCELEGISILEKPADVQGNASYCPLFVGYD
jgi:hypothetical protein